jgi:hypothetical protein
MSCSAGMILRKGYKTKKGVIVGPSCITDIGLPGKGEKLFDLVSPVNFDKYEYHIMMPISERHTILKKALKTVDSLSLLKYMVALRTLNKSNSDKYANLDADVKYLQGMYKPKAKKSPRRKSPKRK